MRSVLVALAGVVVILVSPFPVAAKVFALVPLVMTLVAVAVEEILIAGARVRAARAADTELALAFFDRIAAMPDAEWEQLTTPLERQRLMPVRWIPSQRRPGGAS